MRGLEATKPELRERLPQNAIAAKLSERGVKTAHGGVWTHVQVGAILHPFEVASAAAA